MLVSGLLISCTMPAASWPRVASFSACMHLTFELPDLGAVLTDGDHARRAAFRVQIGASVKESRA